MRDFSATVGLDMVSDDKAATARSGAAVSIEGVGKRYGDVFMRSLPRCTVQALASREIAGAVESWLLPFENV